MKHWWLDTEAENWSA